MFKSLGFVLLWLVGSIAAVAVAWAGVSVVDNGLVDPAPASVPIAVDGPGSPRISASTTVTAVPPRVADPGETPAGVIDSDPVRGLGAATATPPATAEAAEGPTASPTTDRSGTPAAPVESRPDSTTPGASPTAVPALSATSPTTVATAPTSVPSARPTAPAPPTGVPSATTSATAAPTLPPVPTQVPTQVPTAVPTPAPTVAPTPIAQPSPIPPTATPEPTVAAGQTLTFHLIGGSTAISFSPAGTTVLWATPNPGFEVKVEPESPGVKVEFRSDDHRSRIDASWSAGPVHDIREEPDD